jgi:acyl-CoA reductase-like NAD-dependent aldehyde dehydrogenase
VNPADPNEIIGRVPAATPADTAKAIDNAARFFPQWRATPAAERTKIMFKAAEIMRERRWQLAASEVLEVGKGWREADADVCEAIDYLNYYAHQMFAPG